MSMAHISMQERTAVADAMLPSRSFGIVLSGTFADQRMSWAAGGFNNWINHGGGIKDNTSVATGRLTWLPWISPDESNLLHLGLGLRYADVKTELRFATEPEFNKSPVFVDTDFLDADDAMQVNLEASWRRGPVWVGAETLNTAVNSPTYGDLDFDGYQAFAVWALTGEMRSYNKKSGIMGPVPVARTVDQGGKGAWEVAARFSNIDLTDRSIDGGDMDIMSIGVNWWLTPTFLVNANYRYITLNRSGFESSSDAFMTRVLLILE
jgi:phosphate-selective porin OprO/OprP